MHKACGKLVGKLLRVCALSAVVLHMRLLAALGLWQTVQLFPVLYTKFIQENTHVLIKIISVNLQFYTVFTGPIKTTTNKYIGV